MITVSRIICMLACGFVLSIGLSDQTIWAKDGMTDSDFTSRLGGQAGQPYGQVTHNDGSAQSKERLDSRPGERLGGQAGRAYDHVKHEYEPTPCKDESEAKRERAIVPSNYNSVFRGRKEDSTSVVVQSENHARREEERSYENIRGT